MRMRLDLTFVLVMSCFAGCGGSNDTPADLSMSADLHVAADLSGGSGDLSAVAPFNMPGKVFCYNGPLCTTSGATPVCCDSKTDAGFADTCVANAAACTAMDSTAKTFACGQAADCGAGMVCCGTGGTSSGGKPFLDSTACAASCATGETQLCVTAAECKTGTTCAGMDVTGRDVGYCM